MRKFTICAAMVSLGGILAEILLRDILVRTTSGIVLCIVLAIIVLWSGYYALDTAFNWILQSKRKEAEQKKETEEKWYQILNNQIDIQTQIVEDIKNLQDKVNDMTLKQTIHDFEPERSLSQEEQEKITKEINDYTIKTAKVIIKYVDRGMQDLKKTIDAMK